jgi:hypothetical protein
VMNLGCWLAALMDLTVCTKRIESSEPLREHSPMVVVISFAFAMSFWFAVFAGWSFYFCTA